MRNRAIRRWLSVCFTVLFVLTAFAVSQDPDEHDRLGRKDDPAAREQWFRRGRQTRNGEPAAKMLHQAHTAKMRMRAQRESQIRAAAAAHVSVSAPLAASVGTWTNLGPRPIVPNPSVPDGYGNVAGRVTAMAVDQSDPTGNTVFAAGAYGGLWKSTNAAATDPTLVQWTPLMDDQATLSVGAIALQPGNSNVILVGTGEPNYSFDSYYGMGILESSDGGASWNHITMATSPGLNYSLYGAGVSQFAFSTKTTNVVMAATSFATSFRSNDGNLGSLIAGTLLSTDAGLSWAVIPFTNDNSKFYAASASSIVYNPKQDKFYAVLPYFGVYVSQGTSAGGFTSFIRLKNQPGKSGVLSTTACPATFSAACPLLRGTLSVRPVQSPGDPDEMYMWFVSDGNGDAKDDEGIWKSSTDSSGTVTWTSISDSGIQNCGDSYGCGTTQSFYNLYLNAVPNGANTDLYAGTINIYKCSISSSNPTCSTAPFKNLTHVYGCSGISQVHPDQHAMDFLQSNPQFAYFGNDGGVYRSLAARTGLSNGSCGGAANPFDNLNSHIGPLTQFMWGTNHPTDPNTLMGGSQDNGTMAIGPSDLAPGDSGWWSINGGDGGYNWIDPVTPANWYSAYTGVSIQQCTSGINCNTNLFLPIVEEDLSAGSTHQVDGDASNFYTPYILDPSNPSQIIVGTCRVWRGGNSAASWPSNSTANAVSHKLGTTSDAVCQASDDPIQSLAAGGPKGPNGSQVIYAGTSLGHIYVTTNAASGVSSWTDVTGKINPDGFPISAVAIDPQNADGMTAYAVVQGFTYSGYGHVWQTIDGGADWHDITNTFQNVPVNDIVVDPDNHNLYVATDIGVYTSVAGGRWYEVGDRAAPGATGYLPDVAVLHLAIYEKGTDKRLRAWTHGRGVWETPLVNPDLSISTESMFFSGSVGVASPAQSLVLKNLSASAISLGSPRLSDIPTQFAIAGSTCGPSLSPGAMCAVSVDFDPASVSDFTDTLSVPTGSQSYGGIQVALNGHVITTSTDFAFDTAGTSTTTTVTAGATASYTFNITGAPNGTSLFSPSLTLACSGLPNKSACTFSPASLDSPGSVTLTIQTTATTTSALLPMPFDSRFGSGMLAAFTLPGLGLFVPWVSSRRTRKRVLLYSAFFLTFACLLGITACGGGGSTTTTTHTTIPGTPAGTYNVTITGTYGSVVHSQVVTLVVQ